MFVHPRSITVAAFAPPALPGFIAIPAAIPSQGPLQSFVLRSALHTRRRSNSGPKNLADQPGLSQFLWCCSMLSATPEWEARTRPSVLASVACVLWHGFGPLSSLDIGAVLPDSASYASPRSLCPTPCFSCRLSLRVSVLTLSITSRVPSCGLAAPTHFDGHTGWLTTPFLGATLPLELKPFPGFRQTPGARTCPRGTKKQLRLNQSDDLLAAAEVMGGPRSKVQSKARSAAKSQGQSAEGLKRSAPTTKSKAQVSALGA